jgi:hypothetical protein
MASPAERGTVPNDADEEEATDEGVGPGEKPAGQSTGAEALRRQQLVVGTVIASLAGMAVVVAGLQQFPDVTPVLPFGVGMVTTAATFAVVYTSIFGE